MQVCIGEVYLLLDQQGCGSIQIACAGSEVWIECREEVSKTKLKRSIDDGCLYLQLDIEQENQIKDHNAYREGRGRGREDRRNET
jgi:hypothetical protein